MLIIIFIIVMLVNFVFLFFKNSNNSTVLYAAPNKPSAAPTKSKPSAPTKARQAQPTKLKPTQPTRQAPPSQVQIASSNPAYTAGANGWTWDKFAKINPQLAKDPKVKQQFQQGQTYGKSVPSAAYTAGTSGQTWTSFAIKNPNAANVPGAKANFEQGLQTVQNQIKTAGMSGQSWSDYSKNNPQIASIPSFQQQFEQGRQYASTVLSKDFPKPPSSINSRDPLYSAYYAGLKGVSWNDFSKYGAVANSPFPVEIPGGSPRSKIPGAQQAYEMGKQYAARANQYASTSAYGAGVSGQSWDNYVKNNPNAVNVPGAQQVYQQGVDYMKNLPRGSYLNDKSSDKGTMAGLATGLLPIILAMFLI